MSHFKCGLQNSQDLNPIDYSMSGLLQEGPARKTVRSLENVCHTWAP